MSKHTVNLDDIKKMFDSASKAISEKEMELCAIDGVCGDGDHGTAIKGALEAANIAVASGTDIKNALFDAGMAAMSHSNGSTSTLFGSLFMGLSDGVDNGAVELDGSALAKAFASGLDSVRGNTQAGVGDKTLMDALIPAVEAMSNSENDSEALKLASEAADKGAKSTVELQAKFGRARNLGEKSKGTADAGAVSVSIIFTEFAKSVL